MLYGKGVCLLLGVMIYWPMVEGSFGCERREFSVWKGSLKSNASGDNGKG